MNKRTNEYGKRGEEGGRSLGRQVAILFLNSLKAVLVACKLLFVTICHKRQ